jgi:hypothetical protein
MKRLFTSVAALFAFLAFSVVAHGQGAVLRPIEDFVDTQGTFCFPDGMGGCLLFVPPIENFLGQSDPSNGLLSSVDYAGLADEWIGGPDGCGESFGTTFSGSVTETPLADGRAKVHVVLHTRNALTWVTQDDELSNFNNPLWFGYRAPDVCDPEQNVEVGDVALGHITMIVEFINAEPGDPLPDLLQLLVAPEPGQEGPRILFTRARAAGPLRQAFGVADGTPGRFDTTQNGLFTTSGGGATADGFPVERISLRVVGGGKSMRTFRRVR